MRGLLWPRAVVATVCGLFVAVSAHAYIVIPDVQYESPGSTRNFLDVYLPDNGPDPTLPTVVYIHGGGWTSYSKTADIPLYEELVNRGYAVVACNYTLANGPLNQPSFPQAVQDVKNAVRWVRVKGGQHGLSPRIAVVGPSAGGHLAMMAATTSGDPLFETLPPPMGGYRPQAFVSIAGFSDLEWHAQTYGQNYMFQAFLGEDYGPQTAALYQSASPIFHVSPCDPPGGLIHGTADNVVPHQHSLMMSDMMTLESIFNSVSLVENGNHSFGPMGGFVGVAQRIDEMLQVLAPHMLSAEVNGDGQLNVADFGEMLNLFAARDMRTDFQPDGNLNIADFGAFLTLWTKGCAQP